MAQTCRGVTEDLFATSGVGGGVAEALPAIGYDAGSRPDPSLLDQIAVNGLSQLDDAATLALLIRRSADVTDIACARRLLSRFGGLENVLSAEIQDLAAFTEARVAIDLRLVHEVASRIAKARFTKRTALNNFNALTEYLKVNMMRLGREQFRVFFLDIRNNLIRDEVVGVGSVNHAPVYPREIVRRALELDAAALVLVHNHPAGEPTASRADIEITRAIVKAAATLELKVHDHLIVAGNDVISMRALGHF